MSDTDKPQSYEPYDPAKDLGSEKDKENISPPTVSNPIITTGGRRHKGSKKMHKGKRHGNASLRAWVTFVKKVQREEKVSYKEAMMRAKQRKDKGEKWRGGGDDGMPDPDVDPDIDPTGSMYDPDEVRGGRRRRRRTQRRSRSRSRSHKRSRSHRRSRRHH